MSQDWLSWQEITLRLRNPFRVSYGASLTRQAFWLRLNENEGWGEGTIPPYYGIRNDEMIAFWQKIGTRTDAFPATPEEIAPWIGTQGPAPARAALDLAFHDRLGRRHDQPLYRLLKLPLPRVLATAVTIGIDSPEEMARQALELQQCPILKIKLGSEDDRARVAAVREARPDARLFIDANAAWGAEEAVSQLQHLLDYKLELIEQPVAKDDFEGMGYVQRHVPVPVVADETVRTLADVDRLASVGVQGINIKLMKLGGLTPALRLLRRAREHGMRIMLGCMIETSLGVTSVAHLTGMADWLDLDAPLLIANDPFEGIQYDAELKVHMPQRPGIGVIRKEE